MSNLGFVVQVEKYSNIRTTNNNNTNSLKETIIQVEEKFRYMISVISVKEKGHTSFVVVCSKVVLFMFRKGFIKIIFCKYLYFW